MDNIILVITELERKKAMRKFEEIKALAEVTTDILSAYEYMYDAMVDRIKHIQGIIDDESYEGDKTYYKKELAELDLKITCYNKIVAHLEKMF